MPKVDLSASGQMFLCWEQETFLMAWRTQQELSDKRACDVYAAFPKVHGKLVGTDSPLGWVHGAEVSRAEQLSPAAGHLGSQILKPHLSPFAVLEASGQRYRDNDPMTKTLSLHLPKGIGKKSCFQSIGNIE